MKDQLGSMYREDLRSREIEILWNGEPISFEEPSFLEENLPAESITYGTRASPSTSRGNPKKPPFAPPGGLE